MYITNITYNSISTEGLDLIETGNFDDDNFFVELPLDFDINFLGINYTSLYVGSNPYITFGAGSDAHDFLIPDEIPLSGPQLPGVYLSTKDEYGECLDSAMWLLYTGTTDGGNTVIIRFEGNDNYDATEGDTNLVYNFKFYKDQSDYFDLIIEQNEFFCNDDPTGGVSNGVDPTWVVSFDSGPETAYSFYSGEEPPRSANTETVICYTCFSDVNNGNAFYYTNSVPHPVYTDGYGTPVTQLDMVTLGGVNGLNN
jgi:hypothetical protein